MLGAYSGLNYILVYYSDVEVWFALSTYVCILIKITST